MSALLKEAFNIPNKEDTFCSSCNNTGWQKFIDSNGSSFVRRCLKNTHLTNKLTALGVLPCYQQYSFLTYIPHNQVESQAKRSIQKLVKIICPTKIGVILSSSSANGKTHLAISLMKALLAEGIMQPRFVDTTKLVKELDIDLNLITTSERYLLKENISNAELLILDDFAQEPYSEEQKANLEDIIHYRHRNLLPVIITTRLSLDELRKTVTPPIYSRLQEMCDFISLNLIA